MIQIISTFLKRIAAPGFIPENYAITASFAAILLLFPIDVLTGPQISMHIFYVFPLTVIALHCKKNNYVIAAAVLAIGLQIFTLATYIHIHLAIKFYLLCMVILSNGTVVLVARFARINTLEVERLATIDPLTKLYNRRALDVALEIEILRQKRYGGCFSVALIDLDGFKKLNDTAGHLTGDKALILLADLLCEHTRESDTISRIGGDEFVILMPSTIAEDCKTLCELLSQKIALTMKQETYDITASIGYATIEHPPNYSKDVLSIADKAMYEAKHNGKACVVRGYDTRTIQVAAKNRQNQP